MDQRYEHNVFLLLALFRFVAYGIAVILIQVLSLEEEKAISNLEYSLLIGIGVYSFMKVLSRLRWRERGIMTYGLLGGDVLVCVVALSFTGGLSSDFLLYSFTPIFTAGLLFSKKIAVSVSIAICVSLSVPHLFLFRWFDQYDSILQNDNLPWLLLVVGSAFFIAFAFSRTRLYLPNHV